MATIVTTEISINPDLRFTVNNLFAEPPIFVDATAPEALDKVLQDPLALAVLSLHQIPLQRSETIAVGALVGRTPNAYTLIIHPEYLQKKAVFKLEKEVTVLTDSLLASRQLQHYRPDVKVRQSEAPLSDLHQQLSDGSCAALLLCAYRLEQNPDSWQQFVRLQLHPREFVPEPGLGVPAVLVQANNTLYRKHFLPLHDAAVAELTNVERKVLQLIPQAEQGSTGVYCSKDEAGNYHVWAVTAQRACRYVQVSSSTTFGLAERVAEALLASETT